MRSGQSGQSGHGETSSSATLSLGALEQFFQEVQRITRITPEEESHLLRVLALGNQERKRSCADVQVLADAQAARTRLAEGYQPLIIALARRFVSFGDSFMTLLDLVQEGNVGVLEALDAYGGNAPASTTTVGAWVFPHLRWILQRAAWQSPGGMRLPRHVARLLSRLRDAHDDFLVMLHREPTENELAEHMGIPLPHLRDLLLVRGYRFASLDQLLKNGKACDDERFAQSADIYLTGDETMSPRLCEAMKRLTPTERAFVRLRFGFSDGHVRTQQEAANEMSVSLTTVERLYRRVCAALRDALEPPPTQPMSA